MYKGKENIINHNNIRILIKLKFIKLRVSAQLLYEDFCIYDNLLTFVCLYCKGTSHVKDFGYVKIFKQILFASCVLCH
jgi:hypothetical protein